MGKEGQVVKEGKEARSISRPLLLLKVFTTLLYTFIIRLQFYGYIYNINIYIEMPRVYFCVSISSL
jgi:hypothetical protein